MVVKEGYRQTEVGLIPENWELKKIGNLATFSNGLAHEAIISESGDYIVVNSKFISTEGQVKKFSAINLCPLYFNDIAIVMSDIPNGKALAKCYIIEKDNFYTLNQRIGSIHPKIGNCKYYFYQLNRNKYFLSFDSGVGQTNLRKQEILDCPVLIPPENEQTAIATALSDTDALILSLERLIAKKNNIKQGAMQELLRPKDGWKNTTLGEIASLNKGKGLGKNEITPDGRYKCIHYGELFTKYKELIYSILSRTDVNENTLLSKRNDVLMPTSDVTPKGLATASCLMENNVILGGDILVIRIPENIINGVFLSYSITNDKTQILNLVKGVTVYHLYGSDMKKFRFNYPNIQEQNNIVRILTDMETEIEALELKLEKYKMIKQGMIQTLLTGQIRLI